MRKPKDQLAIRLGECIHIARRRQYMSQEKLAEVVGVSSNHISCIERGEYYPSIKLLDKIAGVFGLNLNELLKITNL